MTIDEMKNRLVQSLNSERYQHSVRVMEEACRLASHYRIDAQKAEIAGLLHDCAKHVADHDAVNRLQQYCVQLDDIQKSSPWLLHGLLGRYIAKEEYGIIDEEILSAIYWHTTGRIGMTPLEKIIFIADFTEVGRSFEGIEAVRSAACQDMDLCVLLCSNITIRYVLSRGKLLHPHTVETRNEAILNMMKRCNV